MSSSSKSALHWTRGMTARKVGAGGTAMRVLLGVLLAIPLCIFTVPSNAETRSSRKHSEQLAKTPPETVQELWSGILKLLDAKMESITPEHVENTLGLKFTSIEADSPKRPIRLGADYLYQMREDVPGLGSVSMGLFVDSRFRRLGLNWGSMDGDIPGCLLLDSVSQDLQSKGWLPGRRAFSYAQSHVKFSPGSMPTLSQNKGKSSPPSDISDLTISLPHRFANCTYGIRVEFSRP